MKKTLPLLLFGLSSAASANTTVIYPDQLEYENLGMGVCSTNNRLITHSEAQIYRSDIVNKMG